MPENDARAGIRKIPLHLATFGWPGALVTWYGGWGAAAVLVAWRGYEEYHDWRCGYDTLGKALIDLVSQTIGAVTVAIIKVIGVNFLS
jgi:hypothetical protein